MIRLRGITIDTTDSAGLASFWLEALGYESRQLWEGYAGGRPPEVGDPHVTFQQVATGPNRLHLDLYTDDPDGEADRLVGLGAERVQRVVEGDTWWWVLQDPLGNEFCLIAAQGEDREI